MGATTRTGSYSRWERLSAATQIEWSRWRASGGLANTGLCARPTRRGQRLGSHPFSAPERLRQRKRRALGFRDAAKVASKRLILLRRSPKGNTQGEELYLFHFSSIALAENGRLIKLLI